MTLTALVGAAIHDGTKLYHGKALLCDGTVAQEIRDPADVPSTFEVRQLDGGYLTPGFVDLQVNGGGGVMFNDDQSVQALHTIAQAHASVGTRALLPTLITDTPARSQAAIDAVASAIDAGVPGIVGIHLEGPHLSVSRKGAHDPALIRPMTDEDLAMLSDAARRLPNVMMTVAPENVTREQLVALCAAGVVVSLGHTDADYDTCVEYFLAGASCATHLFNAMSQLGSRAPGLVGAALDSGPVSAGLIADGVHVHPATIRTALRAKKGPGQVFLVTDAMSSLGSDLTQFELNGRTIYRRNGTLRLSDGTLAGADLDLPTAISIMVDQVGVTPQQAIAMATSVPASVLRSPGAIGSLFASAGFVCLSKDLTIRDLDLA